jgi:hypothetical protein
VCPKYKMLNLCYLTSNLNIWTDQETPEYQLQYQVLYHISSQRSHLRLDQFLVHNPPLEDSRNQKEVKNNNECLLQTTFWNIHNITCRAFDARLEIKHILSYLCTISFLYIVILSTYVYVIMTQITKEILEKILEKSSTDSSNSQRTKGQLAISERQI